VRTSLDLRLRVFVLTLEPALQLARGLSLSLEDVEDAVRSSYVQVYKDRGLSLEQIARRVGASRRTIATLSKQAQSSRAPLEHSARIGLRRELIRLVSRSPGVLLEDARAELRAKPDMFHDELGVLIEEGAIESREGKLDLTRAWSSFEGGNEAERLDSLRHFLRTVGQTIRRRFFAHVSDDEAFARVLTFSATPEGFGALRRSAYELLCREAAQADEASRASPIATEASVAFCVTKLE
jgi:transcriptional regulator with XRE-family HTH domain